MAGRHGQRRPPFSDACGDANVTATSRTRGNRQATIPAVATPTVSDVAGPTPRPESSTSRDAHTSPAACMPRTVPPLALAAACQWRAPRTGDGAGLRVKQPTLQQLVVQLTKGARGGCRHLAHSRGCRGPGSMRPAPSPVAFSRAFVPGTVAADFSTQLYPVGRVPSLPRPAGRFNDPQVAGAARFACAATLGST